jgi:hypothetical protein
MVSIAELWLPILVSAVGVFFASSIFHIMIPIHKTDYARSPGEDKLRELLRGESVRPGNYMFPHCDDMKELQSEEMMSKFTQGPVGFMTILPSRPPAMGKSLILWFMQAVIISLLIAYIAGIGLAPGTDYMTIFRVTGTAAIMAYTMGALTEYIWKGQQLNVVFKFIFDGVVYSLLTAGAFGWLWPAGVS